MRNKVRALVVIGVAAVLCCALPAFSQNTDITFTGQTYGDNWNGVGTGQYGAIINGTTTTMVCDDYNHEITSGESWTANGVNVATLTSVAGLQYAGIGINGYTEVAYLVNQMFGNPSSAIQSELSQAIWYITTGGTLSITSGAMTYVTAAINFLNGGGTLSEFANLWLYTPTDQSQTGPQEMWGLVAVPEGGTAALYLLLAGLACFGAVVIRSRRLATAGIA